MSFEMVEGNQPVDNQQDAALHQQLVAGAQADRDKEGQHEKKN